MMADMAVALAHTTYRNARFDPPDFAEQTSDPAPGDLHSLALLCFCALMCNMWHGPHGACMYQARNGREVLTARRPCCGG